MQIRTANVRIGLKWEDVLAANGPKRDPLLRIADDCWSYLLGGDLDPDIPAQTLSWMGGSANQVTHRTRPENQIFTSLVYVGSDPFGSFSFYLTGGPVTNSGRAFHFLRRQSVDRLPSPFEIRRSD